MRFSAAAARYPAVVAGRKRSLKQDARQPGNSCSPGSSREVNSLETQNPKKQKTPQDGHSNVTLVSSPPAAVPTGAPPADGPPRPSAQVALLSAPTPLAFLSSASDHSSLRGQSEQSTGISIHRLVLHNADSSGSHPPVQSQGHILEAVSECRLAFDHQNMALGCSQSTDLQQFMNSPWPPCPTDTTSSAGMGATPEGSVDTTYITRADLEHLAPYTHSTPNIVSSNASLWTDLGEDRQPAEGSSGILAQAQFEGRHARKRLADEPRDSCAAPPKLVKKSHFPGSEESAEIAGNRKGSSLRPKPTIG